MPHIVSSLVEVAVFRFLHDCPEYLVLQRAAGERLYPGLWQLVTGGIEGEERATETLLREIREETGLVPLRLWSAPVMNTFYDAHEDAVHLVPAFAAQVDAAASVRLSAEHQAFLWLPFPSASSTLVWPGQRTVLEAVHRVVAGGEEAARRLQLTVPELRI